MGYNKKREDIDDILRIITMLNKQNRKVTCKSIAQELGQTPQNINRILHQFNIDIKPHQAEYKQKRLKIVKHMELELANYLLSMKTEKLSFKELMELSKFQGSVKEFKKFIARHHIPYFKHVWFIEKLRMIQSQEYSIKELYDRFNLQEHEISIATFRTRLYENDIPFKRIY